MLVWLREFGHKWAHYRDKSLELGTDSVGLLETWLREAKKNEEGFDEVEEVLDALFEDMLSRNCWRRIWPAQGFVLPPSVMFSISSYYLPLTTVQDLLCIESRSHNDKESQCFTPEVDFKALQLRKEMHIVHTRKHGQDDMFVTERSLNLTNSKLIFAGTTIVHSSARFSGRASDFDVCADISIDVVAFLLGLGQLHDGWLTQTSWFSFMQIGVWGQQIVFKR